MHVLIAAAVAFGPRPTDTVTATTQTNETTTVTTTTQTCPPSDDTLVQCTVDQRCAALPTLQQCESAACAMSGAGRYTMHTNLTLHTPPALCGCFRADVDGDGAFDNAYLYVTASTAGPCVTSAGLSWDDIQAMNVLTRPRQALNTLPVHLCAECVNVTNAPTAAPTTRDPTAAPTAAPSYTPTPAPTSPKDTAAVVGKSAALVGLSAVLGIAWFVGA